MKAVFAEVSVLIEIESRIRQVLGEPYLDVDYIRSIGCLTIHESYEVQIMQVLGEFAGRYEIKRAVFGEPDEDGNVEIRWEAVDGS